MNHLTTTGRRAGPPHRSYPELAGRIAGTLGAWVKGQVIVSSILTLLYAIGFAAVGLPFWFVLAPLCGFLNFVPYFGYLIGLGLVGLEGALAGLSFERVIAAVLVFVAVGAVESWYLTPRILGRRLGLKPLWVFAAILVAGTGFGFIGLLLAVPVLAVASVVWRFYNGRENPEAAPIEARPPGIHGGPR